MSQGHGAIENRNDIGSSVRPAEKLRRLVRSGVSFSGRERNCCFVNLQNGSFGNASVASGLDFPDDGRGVATVDWDQDGDLDVWLVNRSGPQLRFMRNEHSQSKSALSISFRLHGRQSNRDAIGARVELKLKGEKTSQIQTVRAGSAYLSQSSKWLHFGTGDNAEIEFVKVHWPGKRSPEHSSQVFRNLFVGKRYHLMEGENQPHELKTETYAANVNEQPSFSKHSATPDHAKRILLSVPLPLPALRAKPLDGTAREIVTAHDKQATLVNLWATWCQPCLKELNDFGERYAALQSAGISVVAVSVDSVDLSHSIDAETLMSTLREMQQKLPFDVAQADNRLLNQLQVAHDSLVDLHEPLPIPSSVLLDSHGKLIAIYKGTTSVEQLLDDFGTLNQSPNERRDQALSFSGKWSSSTRNPRLMKLTLDMLSHSELNEMKEFLQRNLAELSEDAAYPILLFNIGQEHTRRGEHKLAVDFYKQALRQRPTMAPAYFNLGATYAGTRQFDTALICFEQAEKHEPRQLDTRLALARTLTNLGRANEGMDVLLDTAKTHSHEPTLQFELAITFAFAGQVDAAVERFANATKLSQGKLKERFAARFKKAVEFGLNGVEAPKAAKLRRAIGELDVE